MRNEKITPLYECLIRDDELQGESNSIQYRKILYNNYVLEGTLFKYLFEIDQACNKRMEIIVPAMAKQEGGTEALKAADQIEWVRRMNCIRNRAEEIIRTCIYLNEIPLSAMIWLITGFSVVSLFFLLCWQQDGQNHFDTDDLE